ncbi:MAG TPA: glycosyltransferase family A protein [Pyrinomonadaceae bacterium]|nr:glycosyltransferase family A protein [Pyrinomonadaceae bacterium]
MDLDGHNNEMVKLGDSISPLVSLIIPCYRQAHYLGESISSVLTQTYVNVETIVVDDGSPDKTAEVSAGQEVRYIWQRHSGLAAARNTGLHASKGEYIVFLDSDDRLTIDALEVGVKLLNNLSDCGLVYGSCSLIDSESAPLAFSRPKPIETDHYRALFRENYIVTPGCAMFRRQALMQVGGFDECFMRGCEDLDLYLRITKYWPIHGHDRVVLQHRKHRNSMSRKRINMARALNDVLRKHKQDIKGDRELEEICEIRTTPWHQLIWQPPVMARIAQTARLRTRLRDLFRQDTSNNQVRLHVDPQN